MASHAQDCPDWGWKNILPFSRVAASVCILFQGMLSLRSWPGVMVHMLRHYTYETVLTGGQIYIYIYIFIMSVYKYIFYSRKLPQMEVGENFRLVYNYKSLFYSRKWFLWSWSDVKVLLLRHHTHKTVLIVGQIYIYIYLYMYLQVYVTLLHKHVCFRFCVI